MRRFHKSITLSTLMILMVSGAVHAEFKAQCHSKPKNGGAGGSEGKMGGTDYTKGMPEPETDRSAEANKTRPESAAMSKLKDYSLNLPEHARAKFGKAVKKFERFLAKHPDASCKSAASGQGVTCQGASGRARTFKNLDPAVLNQFLNDKMLTKAEEALAANGAKVNSVDGYINSNFSQMAVRPSDQLAFADNTNRGSVSVSSDTSLSLDGAR